MAKQTGYMQITLREFDQSCIRNAPDDAFLQGFQLKAITASGEKADDTHGAVTIAGKVLCNVPAFFEIELAKQSFLYENNIPGYIFLTNQQFSFVHLTAYKQTGNELQLLRREFMKAAGKPPRHFHVVFLSHRYRERDMPLFLQFCKIGVQQVLGSHKRSQVAL